jgi:hypothetical protein
MNCSHAQEYLSMLARGEADSPAGAHVSVHLQSCEACRRFATQLETVHKNLSGPADFSPLPLNEIDDIVSACLDEAEISPAVLDERPPQRRWLEFFTSPRFAFAASLVLLVVAIGLFTAPLLRTAPSHRLADASAASGRSGQRVLTPAHDSSLYLGPACAIALSKGSVCTVLRAESRVVAIDLQSGKILLAAKKGLYDTIAVIAGPFTTFATGTHFEVAHDGGAVKVAVLEGHVRVQDTGGRLTSVNTLEGCSFVNNAMSPLPQRLDPRKRKEMVDDFAAMTAANTRFELVNEIKNRDPSLKGKNSAHVPDTAPLHDSAAARQYAIARAMIDKGQYAVASHVLDDYCSRYRENQDSALFDLAYCYTKTKKYDEAFESYRTVAGTSLDESLAETALHRSNKILLVKVRDTAGAIHGIEEYLKKYPRGAWREEEWYFRIRIALDRHDPVASETLLSEYKKEFPHNCKGRELLTAVNELKRLQGIK